MRCDGSRFDAAVTATSAVKPSLAMQNTFDRCFAGFGHHKRVPSSFPRDHSPYFPPCCQQSGPSIGKTVPFLRAGFGMFNIERFWIDLWLTFTKNEKWKFLYQNMQNVRRHCFNSTSDTYFLTNSCSMKKPRSMCNRVMIMSSLRTPGLLISPSCAMWNNKFERGSP